MSKISSILSSTVGLALMWCVATSLLIVAYAASSIQFSLTVSVGSLTVDIRDSSTKASIASPVFNFGTANFSNSGTSVTGTFPAAGTEIFIDNQDAADSGWSLTFAPRTSATNYVGSGGGNNALTIDSSSTGQLTINSSSATLTAISPTGVTCDSTGVSLGSSTAFDDDEANSGTNAVTSITLLTAAAASADICQYSLTGVSATQTIPANQPAGSYSITMALTITSV